MDGETDRREEYRTEKGTGKEHKEGGGLEGGGGEREGGSWSRKKLVVKKTLLVDCDREEKGEMGEKGGGNVLNLFKSNVF